MGLSGTDQGVFKGLTIEPGMNELGANKRKALELNNGAYKAEPALLVLICLLLSI